MKKYCELSEKERFIRELLESNRVIAQKREFLEGEEFRLNMEKGGFE